jgi:hypothetical protein
MERCRRLPHAGDGGADHVRGAPLENQQRPMARTPDSEGCARSSPDRHTRRRLASDRLPREVALAASRHPSDSARETRRVLSDRVKKANDSKELPR